MNEQEHDPLRGPIDACKTFVEQSKLLMSLASAFIVAPAVIKGVSSLQLNWQLVTAEVFFVISVLVSYVALGAVAGTQYKDEYNVYRVEVMWSGRIQFATYILGLLFFGLWFSNAS